jgi:hypothetical protein
VEEIIRGARVLKELSVITRIVYAWENLLEIAEAELFLLKVEDNLQVVIGNLIFYLTLNVLQDATQIRVRILVY